eukprot:GHUV01043291.1.p1 GENE.GHUV01043291.1~~GHUV01043291.1.p1  ORF type:complete len:125 (+),score=1.56 GHUV01043291.1:28-402(+)
MECWLSIKVLPGTQSWSACLIHWANKRESCCYLYAYFVVEGTCYCEHGARQAQWRQGAWRYTSACCNLPGLQAYSTIRQAAIPKIIPGDTAICASDASRPLRCFGAISYRYTMADPYSPPTATP